MFSDESSLHAAKDNTAIAPEIEFYFHINKIW